MPLIELEDEWQRMCNVCLFKSITVLSDSSLQRVQDALRKGADVNAENSDGDNPLIIAVQNSIVVQCEAQTKTSDGIVKLLVDAGAETKDFHDSVEIFNYLFRRVKTELLTLFFSKGLLLRIRLRDIEFAIHEIAHHGTLESLPILTICIDEAIARGVDMSELFGLGSSSREPLLHAAVLSYHAETKVPFTRLFLRYNVDVFQKNREGLIAEQVATRLQMDFLPEISEEVAEVISVLHEYAVTARFAAFENGLP